MNKLQTKFFHLFLFCVKTSQHKSRQHPVSQTELKSIEKHLPLITQMNIVFHENNLLFRLFWLIAFKPFCFSQFTKFTAISLSSAILLFRFSVFCPIRSTQKRGYGMRYMLPNVQIVYIYHPLVLLFCSFELQSLFVICSVSLCTRAFPFSQYNFVYNPCKGINSNNGTQGTE